MALLFRLGHRVQRSPSGRGDLRVFDERWRRRLANAVPPTGTPQNLVPQRGNLNSVGGTRTIANPYNLAEGRSEKDREDIMGNCAAGSSCCGGCSCGACDSTCDSVVTNVPLPQFSTADTFPQPSEVVGPFAAASGGAIVNTSIYVVTAPGGADVTLQWYKNGVAVSGASVVIPTATTNETVFNIPKKISYKKGDILDLRATGPGAGPAMVFNLALSVRGS